MLTYYIPLCYFVIAFVPLSGKKNLTTKALKGYTKDLNNGS
jgi:hypothetical protein